MKKQWKALGIAVVVAAIAYYPAKKLYEYITKKKEEKDSLGDGEVHVKLFSPAYRGKHKPHHRHTPNGDTGNA